MSSARGFWALPGALVIVILTLTFNAFGSSSNESFSPSTKSDLSEKKPLSEVMQLRGYVKNMQTFQMADLNYVAHGNLVHNRLNFRLYPLKTTTVGLELRNRLFTGDLVNFDPAFGESVDTDNGLTHMSWLLVDEPGLVALTQIDRAWMRWNNADWDITLGRQRINWGLNAFWNSNDLFNTFNLVDFDYEERPGTDALRVQRFLPSMAAIDVAIAPSLNDSTWIAAGMYKFNKRTYDFQLLAGWWNQDVALGAGWAGNLKTAGFKGEVTYFHPQDNWQEESGAISISTSIDYVFKGNLYVMAGALYSSEGTDSTFNINALANTALGASEPPSAKNLMPTRYSTLLSVSRPLSALINGSLVGIYAPGTNLLFLMPSLTVAVANNWEFAVFGQTTFLDNGSEFRNYGTSVFARLKWGF